MWYNHKVMLNKDLGQLGLTCVSAVATSTYASSCHKPCSSKDLYAFLDYRCSKLFGGKYLCRCSDRASTTSFVTLYRSSTYDTVVISTATESSYMSSILYPVISRKCLSIKALPSKELAGLKSDVNHCDFGTCDNDKYAITQVTKRDGYEGYELYISATPDLTYETTEPVLVTIGSARTYDSYEDAKSSLARMPLSASQKGLMTIVQVTAAIVVTEASEPIDLSVDADSTSDIISDAELDSLLSD